MTKFISNVDVCPEVKEDDCKKHLMITLNIRDKEQGGKKRKNWSLFFLLRILEY